MTTDGMICLAVFVAAIVGVAWIALVLDKRKKKKEEQVEKPKDSWTPPGPSADTDQPVPEKPETGTDEPEHESETTETGTGEMEPVNGDPAVLAPPAEPAHDNDEGDEDPDGVFADVLALIGGIVPEIWNSQNLKKYLYAIYQECALQFKSPVTLFRSDNFPSVTYYYGDAVYQYAFDKMVAWTFAMVLVELMPSKRDELYRAAFDFREPGRDVPLFGWTFDTDPTIARLMGSVVYAYTRNPSQIEALREETGGKKIHYQKDVSELFCDLSYFPPAPGPYLKAYEKRAAGYPPGLEYGEHEYITDINTKYTVSDYYNMESSEFAFRQATIQAIANKDHHLEHLFGGVHYANDPHYGQLVFDPVFGEATIQLEIPIDGAISRLADAVGKPSTDNRKSLLNREYGRRRPGQGDVDPSMTMLPTGRALVNYTIEENDGHSTGYYNQGGDYVDEQGHHIGDYDTYYQGQLYANSYPSGHSAYIWGITLALIAAMKPCTPKLMRAGNQFATSRIITRYHYLSDTLIGREIGCMMLPVLLGCDNLDVQQLIDDATKEYENISAQ